MTATISTIPQEVLAILRCMDAGNDTALAGAIDYIEESGRGVEYLPHLRLMWSRVVAFGRLDRTPRKARGGWTWDAVTPSGPVRPSNLPAARLKQIAAVGLHTGKRPRFASRSDAIAAYLVARVTNAVGTYTW